MIAQLSNDISKVNTLYASQTNKDSNSTARPNIMVGESGRYLVSTIPIIEERGITETKPMMYLNQAVSDDQPTDSTGSYNNVRRML